METLNNRSRRELLDKLLGNSGVVIGSVILLIMILIAICRAVTAETYADPRGYHHSERSCRRIHDVSAGGRQDVRHQGLDVQSHRFVHGRSCRGETEAG